MKLPLLLTLLTASIGFAQNPPAPGPIPPNPGEPPHPGGPGGPGGPGAQRGPGQNRPFAEMLKRRIDGNGPLDQLNEEERKRIRSAMEKVWNSDAVKSARDGAAEAAKNYHKVLNEAAAEADPSIKPLLEKIASSMGKSPMGPFQPGMMPDRRPNADGQGPGNPQGGRPPGDFERRGDGDRRPENAGPRDGDRRPENAGPRDGGRPEGGPPNRGPENGGPRPEGQNRPEGAGQPRAEILSRVLGIEQNALGKLNEEQRGKLREAIEAVNKLPAFQEAKQALEKASGEDKRAAFQKLRGVISEAMEREFPDLAKALAALREQRAGERGENGGERGRGDRERGRPRDAAPDQPAPPPPAAPAPPADAPGAPENAPPK